MLDEVDEDEDGIEEEVKENIFKDKKQKTNLPRKHPVPAALTACIAATRYDVVGARLNHVQDTVPAVVKAGGNVTTSSRQILLRLFCEISAYHETGHHNWLHQGLGKPVSRWANCGAFSTEFQP